MFVLQISKMHMRNTNN